MGGEKIITETKNLSTTPLQCWELFNFIRAICKPGPCARAFLNKKTMKINKAEILKGVQNNEIIVGSIVDKTKNSLTVKTLDNFIKITEYEFEGNINIGDRFEL